MRYHDHVQNRSHISLARERTAIGSDERLLMVFPLAVVMLALAAWAGTS